MNRIYKFRAWDKEDIEVRTGSKGSYKQGGYIMQKAPYHPHANKRGYVPEHRLIIENHIGRYLVPRKEFVHHINQIRDDNRIENLQLQGSQNQHAKEHDTGKRNSHGQFLCKEPIFNKIKFRLLNKNTGLTTIYTLNKLISTTFRNGQFEFRGRFTGLKDKKGKEIYESDYVLYSDGRNWYEVKWVGAGFWLVNPDMPDIEPSHNSIQLIEVIGNKYEGCKTLARGI